jgi:hypothetical protein
VLRDLAGFGLSRSYLDGHVCEMRIHHHGSVSRIPVRGLRDGEEVAGAILTMFKRTRGSRPACRPRSADREQAGRPSPHGTPTRLS